MARVFINITSHNKNVTHMKVFFLMIQLFEMLEFDCFVHDPFQRAQNYSLFDEFQRKNY